MDTISKQKSINCINRQWKRCKRRIWRVQSSYNMGKNWNLDHLFARNNYSSSIPGVVSQKEQILDNVCFLVLSSIVPVYIYFCIVCITSSSDSKQRCFSIHDTGNGRSGSIFRRILANGFTSILPCLRISNNERTEIFHRSFIYIPCKSFNGIWPTDDQKRTYFQRFPNSCNQDSTMLCHNDYISGYCIWSNN